MRPAKCVISTVWGLNTRWKVRVIALSAFTPNSTHYFDTEAAAKAFAAIQEGRL